MLHFSNTFNKSVNYRNKILDLIGLEIVPVLGIWTRWVSILKWVSRCETNFDSWGYLSGQMFKSK